MRESEQHEDWLLVGVIVGPVGLHGEVKIALATEFPDRFRLLKTVHLGPERRPLSLASVRQHGARVVLRFAEIADRGAAEAVRGQDLWIPQSQAMPLPPGRYYHHQIVGLEVITTAGEHLGHVEEILETGSNDVYVVRAGEREVLIPAIRDVVQDIDLVRGLITVEAIAGLL
jgi:16S rRNA processing protein RimM